MRVLLGGGFREALGRAIPRRRAAWFESYLQSILQRDVRDLARVEGGDVRARGVAKAFGVLGQPAHALALPYPLDSIIYRRG